jgi:hypothetical protein
MPAIWGIVLAVGAALLGRLAWLDRDRAYYAVILIAVGHYYDLFAVMGGDRTVLLQETIAFVLFAAAAVIGFRTSLWLVATALFAHGVFDFFHHEMISNGGVPSWWPAFCLSFDVVAAGCLALLLRSGAVAARRAP